MSVSQESDLELKGIVWIDFITLLQNSNDKKAPTKEIIRLRKRVATAVKDVDKFFATIRERSDIFESNYFAYELIQVLEQVIHYRNVKFFNRILTEFLPLYIDYLDLVPEFINTKYQPKLFDILLLSYPIKRAVMYMLQPSLIKLYGHITKLIKSVIQASYIRLYQKLAYLYPDLQLYPTLTKDQILCDSFDETVIGNELKKQYLTPWGLTIIKENPPNGDYCSIDEDTISLNATYKDTITTAQTTTTLNWTKVHFPYPGYATDLISIPQKDGSEDVICIYETKEALYWTCPKCTYENDHIGNCKQCDTPMPISVNADEIKAIQKVYPGRFMNHYYIVQSLEDFIPTVYVRYSLPYQPMDDYMLKDYEVKQEPVFHLYSHYALHATYKLPSTPAASSESSAVTPSHDSVSPVATPPLASYNSLFTSILFPQNATHSFTFFTSDIISFVYFNSKRPYLRIRVDKTKASKCSGSLWKSYGSLSSTDLICYMPLNPNLVFNIHYTVLSPDHIIIQVNSSILDIYLLTPIENASLHIASASLQNRPYECTTSEPFAVLGVAYYSYVSSVNWYEIPKTATVFSLIGGHIAHETGLHDATEHVLNGPIRLSLSLTVDDNLDDRPWPSLIAIDERLFDCRNPFIQYEFGHYNDVSCFNRYVKWSSSNHSMTIGTSRVGCLYWKTILKAQCFNVQYTVNLNKNFSSYCIWWISNQVLPNHQYLSRISEYIVKNCALNKDEGSNVELDFQLNFPIAFLVAYHCDKDTVAFQYGSSYVLHDPSRGEMIYQYYLVIQPRYICSVQDKSLIHITSNETECIVTLNNERIFSNLSLGLPHEFQKPDVMLTSGFCGLRATMDSYKIDPLVVSSTEPLSPYVLVPTTAMVLVYLGTCTPYLQRDYTPCKVTYRSRTAYASQDPKLNNPTEYKTDGKVFVLDKTYRSYAVVSYNPSYSFVFFMKLYNDSPSSNSVSVYRNLQCTVKHLKSRSTTLCSCFENNRIDKWSCNSSGLFNYCNVCYQNSTIQLLFYSDVFRRTLFTLYHQYCDCGCDQTTDAFACMKELVLVLTRLQISFRSAEFNSLMLCLAKRFEIGEQHDMCEFLDYILDCIDNCYQVLKKQQNQHYDNPLELIQGKQKESLCCACGKRCTSIPKAKETQFQNSYLNLTLPLYPITNICFEVHESYMPPVKPYTTYTFVFLYHNKGVFMAVERNPTKRPFSNLLLTDSKRASSTYSRISSFHTYSPSQLFSTYYDNYYNYTMMEQEEEIITTTTNRLVVDVLIRLQDSTLPGISKASNGIFELVGAFTIENDTYELYQKVVSFSTEHEANLNYSLHFKDSSILSSHLPKHCDSALTFVSFITQETSLTEVANPQKDNTKKQTDIPACYRLYDINVSNTHVEGPEILYVSDKTDCKKLALYVGKNLNGTIDIELENTSCSTCESEIILDGNSLFGGTAMLTGSSFTLYDNTSFTIQQYDCVASDNKLTSIKFNNTWYHLITVDKIEESTRDVYEYLFMNDETSLQVIIADLVPNCAYHHALYTPVNAKGLSFECIYLENESTSFMFVPNSKSFTGCSCTLEQDDSTLAIAYDGELHYCQKNRIQSSDIVAYQYTDFSIACYVYMPVIDTLSIESMIRYALGIQDQPGQIICPDCSTPVCKRNQIIEFPHYLTVSIPRIVFDKHTYAFIKDCSHITINPSMLIQNETYALYGLVVHVGCSFDSGHYVVYARHSDDCNNIKPDNPSNAWFLYNDEMIYPLTWAELIEEISSYGTCPYLAMYRKMNLSSSISSPFVVPTYMDEVPSFDEYVSEFVNLVDQSNDQILREVETAPFLLQSFHDKF